MDSPQSKPRILLCAMTAETLRKVSQIVERRRYQNQSDLQNRLTEFLQTCSLSIKMEYYNFKYT